MSKVLKRMARKLPSQEQNSTLAVENLSLLQRLQRSKSIKRIGAALVSFLIVLSLHTFNFITPANATTTIATPLSTKGSQIVDATGKAVLLRGVNWFGIETDLHVPHGLWTRDYKEILAQIKSQGYNVIRLPYSVQTMRSTNISGVDYSIGNNKDLNGKTPIQVMDLVIQEAQRQGLFILLDSHRLNDQRIPELWYGDGFTEADWIDTWKLLANRYKNQANVIGADLKNEPHGQASWGTNNQATDWRLAAERCGKEVQSIAPNWLIVVEGVERNVPGQKLPGHWWGGNLEGVERFPVRLPRANKLVYSPHEYGAGVFNQPWFNESNFPNNMLNRWEIGFNYIATKRIAPIWIGEFGGRQVDNTSKEGIWQRKLVDFIKQKNLTFTYWSWNPNSGDTGGILLDDWRTIDAPKQQLLSQLLSGIGFANSSGGAINTASGSSSSSTNNSAPKSSTTGTTGSPTNSSGGSTASPGTNAKPQLKAEAVIQSYWDKGLCVNFRITNTGNAPTRNWQMTFAINQATLTNAWNANFISQGGKYQVTPEQSARVIQPNQSIEGVGYCANKTGSNYKPSQISATIL